MKYEAVEPNRRLLPPQPTIPFLLRIRPPRQFLRLCRGLAWSSSRRRLVSISLGGVRRGFPPSPWREMSALWLGRDSPPSCRSMKSIAGFQPRRLIFLVWRACSYSFVNDQACVRWLQRTHSSLLGRSRRSPPLSISKPPRTPCATFPTACSLGRRDGQRLSVSFGIRVDQAPRCRFSIMSVILFASSVIINGLVITSMPASR